MQTKSILAGAAAAIALAAGVGLASADENLGTLDGISVFDSLAGIQAVPLDTDEMASVTAAHWLSSKWYSGTYKELKNSNSIWHEYEREHGVKYYGKGYGADWVTTTCLHAGFVSTCP